MNEAAEALRARADVVAARAADLTLEALPAYAASLDARGRLRCREDSGFHLRALVGSVAAGDTEIFGDYAVWAAGLLRRFGVPSEALAAAFRATGKAIGELVPSASADVQPHLEAGERALVG